MQELSSFDYAIIRVVPHVERGECINAGIILFCRARNFLGALISLDVQRLYNLAPDLDPAIVQDHLDTILRVSQGGADAGPIGLLSQTERFHWLVAPRSTIIQTSPVHSGLSADPALELDHLLKKMVLPPQPLKETQKNKM